MHIKTILFINLAVLAVAIAGGYDHGHAHYKFAYGIHDPHSHDVKYQHEHRDGKHLAGGYGLKEPDGTQRVVKYKSGPHSGFEAIVARHGFAKHPPVYGKYHKHGGKGGTSYVGVIHWQNQGPAEYGGHKGHEGHGGHGGVYEVHEVHEGDVGHGLYGGHGMYGDHGGHAVYGGHKGHAGHAGYGDHEGHEWYGGHKGDEHHGY